MGDNYKMTDKPENPQAFPLVDDFNDHQIGMTLRGYFAGQALAGLLSHPECTASNPENDAEWAYKYADGMLKERTAT